jgi:gamma-glutamyl phosphate reductase
MKILFTGKSKLDYNRVKVIKAGLEQIPGVEIIELLLKKGNREQIKQLKQLDKEVDFIYIPPFRHSDVSYVKKHTTKPIVFDQLISKY